MPVVSRSVYIRGSKGWHFHCCGKPRDFPDFPIHCFPSRLRYEPVVRSQFRSEVSGDWMAPIGSKRLLVHAYRKWGTIGSREGRQKVCVCRLSAKMFVWRTVPGISGPILRQPGGVMGVIKGDKWLGWQWEISQIDQITFAKKPGLGSCSVGRKIWRIRQVVVFMAF